MPQLLYACLDSVFGRETEAPFDGAYSEARYHLPKLSVCALYTWSLAFYDDPYMTFAEGARIEQELNRLARRHTWFDTSVDDIIPDICHIMITKQCGYRYALHDLVKLWTDGTRYAAPHDQRKSDVQEMTNVVIRDWVKKHDNWRNAKNAILRAKEGHSNGTDGDAGSHKQRSTHDNADTRSQGNSTTPSPDSINDINDAFQVLGVPSTSSIEEVKSAYRRQMREWHPDKLNDMAEELKAYATKRVALINSAYSLIMESRSHSSSR